MFFDPETFHITLDVHRQRVFAVLARRTQLVCHIVFDVACLDMYGVQSGFFGLGLKLLGRRLSSLGQLRSKVTFAAYTEMRLLCTGGDGAVSGFGVVQIHID